MRNHIQGIFLIILLLGAIWGLSVLAGPALSDAFGDNGAVSAESGDDEDQIELTVAGESLDVALEAEERTQLQFLLLRAGFLTDLEDVDGIFGPKTDEAIELAIAEWGLDDPTDREVLEHADQRFADVPFLPAG